MPARETSGGLASLTLGRRSGQLMAAAYFVLAVALLLFAASALRRSRFPLYGRALAVLVLAYGLVVKPLFVVLRLPSEAYITEFVLEPLTEAEYWAGSVMLLGCYGLFVGAMVLTSWLLRAGKRKKASRVRFASGRGWPIVGLAMAALAAFLVEHPELLQGASKNILATEDLADYSSSGGLRLLISLLYVVPFLMIANVGQGYRVAGSQRLMWFSALLWIAFCFFSDQRGAIVFSLVSWLIGWRTFVGPLNRKLLALGAAVALGMVLLRSLLRITGDPAGTLAAADELLGNYIGRNLVENGKTLIIIRAIPEQLRHAWGGSYLDSILILVPRALFPGKLTVNLDTVMGQAVFDCPAFGACAVPPGLIAETYYNFGWAGLPILVFCGWLTAWLDWKAAGSSVPFKLLYAATLVYFGISVLGSGISSFTTQLLMDAIAMGFVYASLRHSPRRVPGTAFASGGGTTDANRSMRDLSRADR